MMTECIQTQGGVSRWLRRTAAALSVAVLGAGLGFAPSASAQNLVANPNFAITGGTSSFWFGGFSAWGGGESLGSWSYIPSGTTSNNNGAGFDFVSGAQSACFGGSTSCTTEQILPVTINNPTGNNFLAFDAAWGNATQPSGVSQTISGLTVGTSYVLSFSYAVSQWYQQGIGTDSAAFTAILTGTSAVSQTTGALTAPQQGFSGWATATFTYVASATTETLQLLASGGSGQPPLALLANVSLTKAPEPMSIAVLGSGLFGLVAVARKRRAPPSLA